jgi:glycerol-3-phosphate dehydrogenase subunit C
MAGARPDYIVPTASSPATTSSRASSGPAEGKLAARGPITLLRMAHTARAHRVRHLIDRSLEMMNMAAISRESLMTLEAYAKARKDFRAKVIAHKKNRTVHLSAST